MTRPTLPADDADPARRASALADDRATWTFDHTWQGITMPHPDSIMREFRWKWFGRPSAWPHLREQQAVLLGVGTRWMRSSLPFLVRASLNNRLARVARRRDDRPPLSFAASRARRRRHLVGWISDRVLSRGVPDPTPPPYDHRSPATITDYRAALTLVDEPPAAEHWSEDWWFARERVAGCSPMSIALVDDSAILDRIPLTHERFVEVRPGDTLDAAIAERRLFVVDHSMLAGLDAGDSYGWRQYLCAPIALFALDLGRRELHPVAIQCAHEAGDDVPVITPADGMAWQMAKVAFAAAESNFHGVAEHGAFCHITIGGLAVALRRSFAPWHPVRVLLEPHIEHTIPIALATKNLFEPGGRTATLQAVTAESCGELVRRARRSFDWTAQSGRRHFEGRGVADPSVLPHYPMRDDIALLDDAIDSFVSAYVAIYYVDDASVRGDTELQSWVDELRDPAGADQPSVPDLDSVAALTQFLHDVIWRASPYHAVINYGIGDAMAFVPNMPTATYAPPPTLDRTYQLSDLETMLPPLENCAGIVDDVVQVAGLRLNHLGQYRKGHFVDDRVPPLVDRFQADLAAAGDEIDRRNTSRRVPFELLHPRRVTASIHI